MGSESVSDSDSEEASLGWALEGGFAGAGRGEGWSSSSSWEESSSSPEEESCGGGGFGVADVFGADDDFAAACG